MKSALQRIAFGLYYPYCRVLGRLLPNITLEGYRLRVLSSVYKPLDSEHQIADYLQPGKRVLDVGCGSGVITLFAALKSEHVTAIDISPQAVENTRLNLQAHGIQNATAMQSDMYAAVSGQRFDYIISYPPLYQGTFSSQDQQWCTSNTFVDRLFAGATEHLHPGGQLVVLLPERFRLPPEELGRANGLNCVAKTRHDQRSIATRLHGLPYLHFNLRNHVFQFEMVADSTTSEAEDR